MVLGWLMYYKDDRDQLGIDDFFLPFGGKLKKDNRWVRMAEIMPWDYIEEVYLESMSQETGNVRKIRWRRPPVTRKMWREGNFFRKKA